MNLDWLFAKVIPSMENNGTDAREAAKAPMLVCHGSNVVVEIPRIIKTKF